MFHILGDTLEIWPSSSEEVMRLEFFGEELEKITRTEAITHTIIEEKTELIVFPAKHFVTSKSIIDDVIPKIKEEMESQIAYFQSV